MGGPADETLTYLMLDYDTDANVCTYVRGQAYFEAEHGAFKAGLEAYSRVNTCLRHANDLVTLSCLSRVSLVSVVCRDDDLTPNSQCFHKRGLVA